MKLTTRLKRALTFKNIKLAITIGLGLATSFGIVAPDTATSVRNQVLVPLEIASSMTTGDL